MNTYIIDPMFFYWINVVSELKVVVAVAAVLSMSGCIFMIIKTIMDIWSVNEYPSISENNMKAIPGDKKLVKYFIIACLALAIVLIFVPSKETIMYMQISKMATVENAELTVDAIKSAVDYIIEAMKSVNSAG